MLTHPQLTNSVLMVRPNDFGFNPETAADNEFMKAPSTEENEVIKIALKEFEASVKALETAGIEVLVLEKQEALPPLPDAVFPNNWFSTRADGVVFTYPMYAASRQNESLQLKGVEELLLKNNYQISGVWHVGPSSRHQPALEGTGSIVFNHKLKQAFASISARTEVEILLPNLCKWLGYTPIAFNTQHPSGQFPIYHTNVVLSIGEEFSVYAEGLTKAEDQEYVRQQLELGGEVISLSNEQTLEGFCANLLQLSGTKGKVIALSSTALAALNPNQIKQLEKHGNLVALPITTIESIGGGSARCMLAENFLPKIR